MGRPLLPAFVLSAVAVVAAILGSLVIFETASIKLTVPAARVVADKTLNGGPSGADLVTTRIHADVADTEQGTTSTVDVPAAPATGQVKFHLMCPCQAVTEPAGTVVATTKGFRYLTTAQVVMQQGTQSQDQTVGVRANVSGAAGNTAPNTVTVIENNTSHPNLSVTNPQPITGGADATTAQVVQQSDLDRVRSELTDKVTLDLGAALKAQAEGLGYVPDGQPTLTTASDHQVGDHTPTFTMTISATQAAIAFSSVHADALMRTALEQKVPKGFALTADPVQTSYQVQKTSANGDVTIKGSAIGVAVPNVTSNQLKARIKGMRVDAARRQLEQLAPGVTADITVRPAIPWLPVLQDHITLTIVRKPVTV